ncbi:SusD/RagB family nutrient-binding outer membrane lipoprotein [Anditalea andensis]|uniref:SusD/RagB family nutrient-binding outer membrane lipoprotein n=1 Tax=Anditalea andensis TaxID=1048983 RepID=A0A074LKY3_9BACT|nr:SusD/RagB family nutrient-binding outer membrane lipoprotein [Anditalea andensis]KEO74502.1 hypothetical protein EL17_07120 [Anditalea andensis]
MKKLKNIRLFVIGLLAFSITSCDEFLDVNENPNQLIEVPANTLLTSSTLGTATLMGTHLHRYSAVYTQQFSAGTAQIWDLSRYLLTETDMNDVWRPRLYSGVLNDLKRLEERTLTTSPHYAGISRILQGFLFMTVVDNWGDVPFTEALQLTDNLTPAYDNDEAIYTGIIAMIDSGIELTNSANSTFRPAGDDLIYNGDLAKWRRLANTIKLRLYLHYYPTNAALATQSISTLLGSGAEFIAGNVDNFQVRFLPGDADRANPISQFEVRRQNQFFPAEYFVSLMNTKADPRRPFYFTQFGTNYVGIPVNSNQNTSTNYSRMHVYLRGAVTSTNLITGYAGDAPLRMLTFAEYHFILAEYHARNNRIAESQLAYTAGITASMTNVGVAVADIATYIASRPILTSANAIQQIIEEKYVANYGVASEPWVDWRRTGFPQLTPMSAADQPQIPRILPYAELERVTNRANTPARGKPEIIQPGVFWDPGL